MARLLKRAWFSGPALLLLAACASTPDGDHAAAGRPPVTAAGELGRSGAMPPRGLSAGQAVTIEELAESREVTRPTTLRDAPFVASNVLMPLHPGDEVKVTGRLPDGSWYRVATADGEGWVRPSQLNDAPAARGTGAIERVRLAPAQPAALPVSMTRTAAATTTLPSAKKSAATATKRSVTAKPVQVPPRKVVAKGSPPAPTKTAVKKPVAKPTGKDAVQVPARKPASTAAASSRSTAS